MFSAETSAIIRGSPSGTAITMIITARIIASRISPRTGANPLEK